MFFQEIGFSLIIRNNRIPILEVYLYDNVQNKYKKLKYKSSIGYIYENFSQKLKIK